MRSHSFDPSMPLFLDREAVTTAQLLMAEHGIDAGQAAANRARESRNLGNHIAFCRWRQVERLLAVLVSEETMGTRH